MERPIFKPIGTLAEELDTPSLVVDLSLMEGNLATVHSFFGNLKAKLRPHIEAHRCPAIAHKQLDAGGTVGGIAVTTLGQAEVFSASGFTDISVTNVIVTSQKIARLCALAKSTKMTVAVDDERNVNDLSEAANANGLSLDVLVHINTRLNSYGVDPGKPAVDLAKAISRAPALRFAGLTSYSGDMLDLPPTNVAAESRKWVQCVLDTREMVEKAGLDVNVVSVGSTHDYEVAALLDGVTEVTAGTYVLMDEKYRQRRPQLHPAASIVATVTSVPENGMALTDGGQKAIGADTGLPSVDNIDGVTAGGLSAEHGKLVWEEDVDIHFELGDRIWQTPWDIGACANLHDYIFAIRDSKLEAVWDVSARGRYR